MVGCKDKVKVGRVDRKYEEKRKRKGEKGKLWIKLKIKGQDVEFEKKHKKVKI